MNEASLRWAPVGLEPAERSRALEWLTAPEFDRYAELAPGVRDSFLQGRMLLRELAAELIGGAPSDIVITAMCADCGGPHGRPEVEGSDIRLSLSRCGLALVAVATRGLAVGVDVEPVHGSSERLVAIGSLAGIASLRQWTRVEAVLKADGRGLRVDPANVQFVDHESWVEAKVLGSDRRYRITDPAIAPDLQASLAVQV